MGSITDRIVYRRADGAWVNQRINAKRPSSVHATQVAATIAARIALIESGGGELTIKAQNGRIRRKDAIGGR